MYIFLIFCKFTMMKKSTAQHNTTQHSTAQHTQHSTIFTINSNILQAVSFARIFSFSSIFRRVGVMVAHKPSKLDDASPVRKRGFDSRTLLSYARSVTAAQRLSVPYWGFQPLGSGSIPDGRAKKIPLLWRGGKIFCHLDLVEARKF